MNILTFLTVFVVLLSNATLAYAQSRLDRWYENSDKVDRFRMNRDRRYSPVPRGDEYGRNSRRTYQQYRHNRSNAKAQKWINNFGINNGGWSVTNNPRYLADVNGDGRADVVGFANDGVYVSLSRGRRFAQARLWVEAYGSNNGGWNAANNPRFVSDVNGDGRADIVGFANDGVYVSLARRGRFTKPRRWVVGYGINNGGWNVRDNPRYMADVNGDGRADVVGISNNGVYVSLSRGNRFTEPRLWIDAYGINNGDWSMGKNLRYLVDVNDDGRADIVGFGTNGVYVSLSRGNRFTEPRIWTWAYSASNGGWSTASNPRHVVDVNGDGRADIVGFANDGVYVSLARRTHFIKPKLWVKGYGIGSGGWSVTNNPRFVIDINGDGLGDVVGFANDGVYFSLSNGRRFTAPKLWVNSYGSNTGGWNSTNNVRLVADVNGDRRGDIIGIANDGVYVTLSREK